AQRPPACPSWFCAFAACRYKCLLAVAGRQVLLPRAGGESFNERWFDGGLEIHGLSWESIVAPPVTRSRRLSVNGCERSTLMLLADLRWNSIRSEKPT
ncbi:unnamed protein product, partial [Polarella glacialis]